MPWGCSERRRLSNGPSRCLVLGILALGLSLGDWAWPRPASVRAADQGQGHQIQSQQIQSRQIQWRQGVFPVLAFSGYTSFYGSRTGPWGAVEPHYGLDIAAPLGSAVRNWWGGTVTAVIADDRCGVGLQIRSGGYEHIYCHLLGSSTAGVYRCGTLQIRTGQRVHTGQLIGRIGVSGRSTGPHLHWGLRYGGQWLNPVVILQAMAQSRRNSPQG